LIAYAAIDLRGGRVVQLVGGRVEQESISWPDPLDVAQRWVDEGFAALHIVDLDAALAAGSNRDIIEVLIKNVRVPVQVGGGVRDDQSVQHWLDAGAAKVIVGTRAVEDATWRHNIAEKHPHQLIVAADVRDGHVVTRGWQAATSHEGESFVASLNTDALAGVLVTDVSREGQMLGIDQPLFRRLSRASHHPVIAAGGIRDEQDLHALANAGVAGAVLGMALYQGAIDPAVITPVYAT
jgi:phosphoribosylformimino-5-aminoimidazole carboxamide ribotide isomerase